MDKSERYQISNAKIIARLLPFWARGRKLFSLIYGSLKPIESIHETFYSWAKYCFMEIKIPFNRAGIEYVLTKELNNYFANKEDKFNLGLKSIHGYPFIIDSFSHRGDGNHTNTYIYPVDVKTDGSYIYAILEDGRTTKYKFNILAPKLMDVSNEKEYTLAIQRLMAKYTITKKYTIQIQP